MCNISLLLKNIGHIVDRYFPDHTDRWGYEQFNDGTSQSLDTGEYKVKCTGFQFSPWRYYTLHILSIIMFGVPYLILSWYPQYMAKFGYKRCQLKVADAVIVRVNIF